MPTSSYITPTTKLIDFFSFVVQLAGTFMNIAIIYICGKKLKIQQTDILLSLCIGVCDLLNNLCNVFSSLYAWSTRYETLNDSHWICQYAGYTTLTSSLASIDLVACLGVIRYCSIVKLKSPSKKSVTMVCSFATLVSFVSLLPFLIKYKFEISPSGLSCKPIYIGNTYLMGLGTFSTVKMAFSWLLLFTSYMSIAKDHRKYLNGLINKEKARASLINPHADVIKADSSSEGTTKPKKHLINSLIKERLHVYLNTLTIVMSYLFLLLPMIVLDLVYIISGQKRDMILDLISTILFNLICILNPVLLVFSHPEVKHQLLKQAKKLCLQ